MVLHAFGRLQINNERLIQACKKQVRMLSEELALRDIDSTEAGFRSLRALDAATEGVLRRQRRQLANMGQAAPPLQSDPWASHEERLLRRMAQEEPPIQPFAERAAK